MTIAVGIGCLVTLAALGRVTCLPEQQLVIEHHSEGIDMSSVLLEEHLERQDSNNCVTKGPCRVSGGKCQTKTEACDGELRYGRVYCKKAKKCVCCIPAGCTLDGRAYKNGSLTEDRCILLQCINGAWEYYKSYSEYYAWNECNHCYSAGNTNINMRDYHLIDGSTILNYHVNGTGTYAFSQSGLDIPAQLIMEATFEYINEYQNETHITSVTYKEPGIIVELVFPSPSDYEYCNDHPTDPHCEAKLMVNDFRITLNSTFSSVASFYGLIGTVFIVNRGNHWPYTNHWGRFYIVGSQGTSVRVDYGGWYAVYAVSMALASLQNKVFGLCDVLTGGIPTGFTTSDGSVTTDINEFVQSWKVDNFQVDNLQSEDILCNYNHKGYPPEYTLETTCLVMECTQGGDWSYKAIINTTCGACQVYGDPQFQPFSNGYYNYQKEGPFVITQIGRKNTADLFVNSYFLEEPLWPGYTAARVVTYFEPGCEVIIELPLFSSANCFTIPPSTDSECDIKILVNQHTYIIGTKVNPIHSDAGTVLIFESNHVPSTNTITSRCMNIVGSNGLSLSFCMSHTLFYSYLYVWAMPTLKGELYGLCDQYTTQPQNSGYTPRTGALTEDITLFAQSWQPIQTGEAYRLRKQTSKRSQIESRQQSLGNRCTNGTVSSEVEAQCANITEDICQIITPYKCAAFTSSCEYDLCRVSHPDYYAQGYADHLLIESHFNQ